MCKSSRGFQQGHPYFESTHDETTETQHSSVWMPRLDREDFSRVVQETSGGLFTVPDADGISGGSKILRPRPNRGLTLTESYLQPDENQGLSSEMRLLNVGKNAQMWNECYTEHAEQNMCPSPQFQMYQEQQIGLCWKESLKCVNCEYHSRMYKLYSEIETGHCGQRAATTNVALHIGLQDTTTATTKFRHILTAMHTPPPSHTGLQRTANKVAALTAQATMDDLRMRRQRSKETNTLRGLPEDAPINISVDVRYNSTNLKNTYSCGGQNASQALGTAFSWQTGQREIIAFQLDNKLCKLGSSLRSKGLNVTCPGHVGCTANVPATEPLSEYRIGKRIGDSLARDGVAIKYVATDGDALASRGIQDAMPAGMETERQSDTTHLSQTQFRHIMKASFSSMMFPGENAARRTENRRLFAEDVKTRCQMVYTSVHMLHDSDETAIATRMPDVIQATLDCYAGSCANCRRHAIVCRGGRRNWWNTSPHLKACGLTRVNMTDGDRSTLQGLIEMRLGHVALHLTRRRLTTNPNESANRAFSASLPKNVKFSRNALGRVCSVIDRLNYGAGESMLRKLENVQCPITKGGKVARAVKRIQQDVMYQREYARQPAVRRHRRATKSQRMKDYFKAKQQRSVLDVYRKRQLDRRPASQTITAATATHTPVRTVRRRRRRAPPTPHGNDTEHSYSLRSRKSADHPYAKKL